MSAQEAAYMVAAFALISRPLDYRPAAGGPWAIGLRGVLRRPTAAELAGGLDRRSRLAIFVAADLDGIGTPAKGDRVRDPATGEVYAAVEPWDIDRAGDAPVFYRAEVSG